MAASAQTIAAVVAGYFFISISLVFTNKLLMSDKKNSMDAPLFVTWFQCVVTVAICWTLGKLGKSAAPGTFLAQFPEVKYDLTIGMKIMKLSAVFVGMITFNNLCLKYVEVSFYNVARSLTICFNVVFTLVLLGQRTSSKTLGCLAVVVVGFFLGSDGEVNFSWTGTMFGICASCFVSLNSIFTKGVMEHVNGNKWKLAAYNNINAVLLFIPLMLVLGELDVILANTHLFLSTKFWGMMMVGGAFGFMIGIMSILQIKVTSPLTHNISGTAKAAFQSVLAFYIFGNPTTAKNMLGIATVLGGSLLYSYVRRQEMAEAAAAKAAASEKATRGLTEAELTPISEEGSGRQA